jgi:hypothetical protein
MLDFVRIYYLKPWRGFTILDIINKYNITTAVIRIGFRKFIVLYF